MLHVTNDMLMNYKGVYRTAPATPGLLKMGYVTLVYYKKISFAGTAFSNFCLVLNLHTPHIHNFFCNHVIVWLQILETLVSNHIYTLFYNKHCSTVLKSSTPMAILMTSLNCKEVSGSTGAPARAVYTVLLLHQGWEVLNKYWVFVQSHHYVMTYSWVIDKIVALT